MIIDRPADARGRGGAGWLDSRHTFSFAGYYDPAWMGFGPLRVINEDRVAPGAGFPPHRHANMEILSYVLEGALAHRDDNGGGGVIHAGELQWMGAGHGIEHSEYNGSDSEPVHFLQIWIQPDRLNAQPAYAQRMATGDDAPGQWQLLVSPDGASGSIAIRQNMRLFLARLQAGATIERELDPQRHYWLQVTRGAVQSKDRSLAAGDAMGLTEEGGTLELATTQPSEILLFDLP